MSPDPFDPAVAIARRLLGVIFSLLRSGQKYALALEAA